MSCCDCKIDTSEVYYDGSNRPSIPINPGDDLNEIITNLIAFINSNSGLNFINGQGISIVRSGQNITIANTLPRQVQVLSILGQVVSLSNGGGSITLPTASGTQIQSDWNQASTSALDYIKNKPNLAGLSQTLSYNSGTGVLSISGGNNVTIPNLIYTAGSGINISGGGVISNTAPNVTQTLSIAGSQLSISGGNTINLPSQAYDQTIYYTSSSLSLAAYPDNNTFVLSTTVTAVLLTAASSEPVGREIKMVIRARPASVTFSVPVVYNGTNYNVVACTEDTFLHLKVSNNGSNYIWQVINKNNIASI